MSSGAISTREHFYSRNLTFHRFTVAKWRWLSQLMKPIVKSTCPLATEKLSLNVRMHFHVEANNSRIADTQNDNNKNGTQKYPMKSIFFFSSSFRVTALQYNQIDHAFDACRALFYVHFVFKLICQFMHECILSKRVKWTKLVAVNVWRRENCNSRTRKKSEIKRTQGCQWIEKETLNKLIAWSDKTIREKNWFVEWT